MAQEQDQPYGEAGLTDPDEADEDVDGSRQIPFEDERDRPAREQAERAEEKIEDYPK